jgi:hypothetical protein
MEKSLEGICKIRKGPSSFPDKLSYKSTEKYFSEYRSVLIFRFDSLYEDFLYQKHRTTSSEGQETHLSNHETSLGKGFLLPDSRDFTI